MVDPTARGSFEWRSHTSIEQPTPPVYRFANYKWSNCGGKLPLTATTFNVSVQWGNVIAYVGRFQLAMELESAVLLVNATRTINGSVYKEKFIYGGLEYPFLQSDPFPLPARSEVVVGGLFLYDGPTYHNTLIWQFIDADLNTVACTLQDYDVIRQVGPQFSTATAEVYD